MSATSVFTYTDIPPVGYIPMPADFPYLDILLQGRPGHDSLSDFGRKHPKMSCSRRAKIFAPFDALKGFNEAVASKEVAYIDKPELSDCKKESLDRKLTLLGKLTCTKKAARQNAPLITVTYFLTCSDIENDAYGIRGTLETASGICHKVDTQISHTITVGNLVISLDDVIDIIGTPSGTR